MQVDVQSYHEVITNSPLFYFYFFMYALESISIYRIWKVVIVRKFEKNADLNHYCKG